VAICEVGDERVPIWYVVYSNGHDHADGCEKDSIWGGAALETRLGCCKGRLVYMAVYPVAIFKVIDDKGVNSLEGWV
jgi:hypothetical protein